MSDYPEIAHSPVVLLDESDYSLSDKDPELLLIDSISRFKDDPYGFVLFAYEWGEGKLEHFSGPMTWQKDILVAIGEAVKENGFGGQEAVEAIRMAVASGHGIGKSALTAWLVDWIMSTRPFAKGTVTANTSAQLETKTWAEIAKWTKMLINAHWFKVNTGRGSMKMSSIQHPESWYCTAQTCREENSEAFAGQHAVDSTSFYIFDEASAVPNKIWEVAEGGLTDGEPMMFVFGNPTRNTGRFFDCFHSRKKRWETRKIDSRTVAITNKSQIDEWEEDYGDDSDFFRVRVKGEFPAYSASQLISMDEVMKSMKRKVVEGQFDSAPVLLGVDVAWQGDDKSVIVMRQGGFSKVLGVYDFLQHETMSLADMVVYWMGEVRADAVFIDTVGVGAGVYDRLKQRGYNPISVQFQTKPNDPEQFRNKRAECWWNMREWISDIGVLPEDNRIKDDLTAPEYFYTDKGQVMLESKKDMKKRGLRSPDVADALALTFAHKVVKQMRAKRKAKTHYDVANYGLDSPFSNNYASTQFFDTREKALGRRN